MTNMPFPVIDTVFRPVKNTVATCDTNADVSEANGIELVIPCLYADCILHHHRSGEQAHKERQRCRYICAYVR